MERSPRLDSLRGCDAAPRPKTHGGSGYRRDPDSGHRGAAGGGTGGGVVRAAVGVRAQAAGRAQVSVWWGDSWPMVPGPRLEPGPLSSSFGLLPTPRSPDRWPR